MNGVTVSGFTFQASYTYMRSRDQSSFSCCSATQGFAAATTAGNPNRARLGDERLRAAASILLTASYALSQSVELTTVTRLMSGTPYTPMVSGDINGDGAANDRAFIFGSERARHRGGERDVAAARLAHRRTCARAC